MKYLQDTLSRRVVFFTGKGGVGKSTLAWGTALACQRAGKKVAVLGWKPLGKEDNILPKNPWGIPWLGLDTLTCFREYALQIVKFERLYDNVLDNKVLRTFVLAAPGLTDAVIAGKIWDVDQRGEYDLILIDMPATGHARAFFKSPLGLQKIFKVGFIARDTERVCALFRDKKTRLDLIALPEELPLVECRELKESLQALHPFSFGFLHINQCLPEFSSAHCAGLGGDLEKLVDGFNQRWQEQREVLKLAKPIGLPPLEMPRFPTENWIENIEATATQLER